MPGLAANRLQPQRNSIELVVRTARLATKPGPPLQRAVQAVGPRVVRTGNPAARVPALGDQLHAAVTAHVMERPNGAGAVAQQQERDAGEIVGQKIARMRKIAGDAHAYPRAGEDAVALELEKLGVGIKLARQADRARRRAAQARDRLGADPARSGKIGHRKTPVRGKPPRAESSRGVAAKPCDVRRLKRRFRRPLQPGRYPDALFLRTLALARAKYSSKYFMTSSTCFGVSDGLTSCSDAPLSAHHRRVSLTTAPFTFRAVCRSSR